MINHFAAAVPNRTFSDPRCPKQEKHASAITQKNIIKPEVYHLNVTTGKLKACISISASRCGYHAEDGRWCDCNRMVMFECLWRNYGEIVIWCNRTRKFVVFNLAK